MEKSSFYVELVSQALLATFEHFDYNIPSVFENKSYPTGLLIMMVRDCDCLPSVCGCV